jgi:hypothetical protein
MRAGGHDDLPGDDDHSHHYDHEYDDHDAGWGPERQRSPDRTVDLLELWRGDDPVFG